MVWRMMRRRGQIIGPVTKVRAEGTAICRRRTSKAMGTLLGCWIFFSIVLASSSISPPPHRPWPRAAAGADRSLMGLRLRGGQEGGGGGAEVDVFDALVSAVEKGALLSEVYNRVYTGGAAGEGGPRQQVHQLPDSPCHHRPCPPRMPYVRAMLSPRPWQNTLGSEIGLLFALPPRASGLNQTCKCSL